MITGGSGAPRAAEVARRFLDEFGGSALRVFFAPGRVNLVGAHLDYNGGDVLPLATDLGIYVAARLRPDRRIRLRSLDQESIVDVDAGMIGNRRDPAHGWASYPLGVYARFRAETGCDAGIELTFGGDLPMASGLSSSAAIEVATGTALDRLHGTALSAESIAMIGHRAETEYVGLQCGIMDQFASALARPDHVLLLHCHSRRAEYVPMDRARFEVLVMDTRKPRELAASGFNQRVRECREAHEALRSVRDLPCLAAYTLPDLERAGSRLGAVQRRRARHVVTEMTRVAAGVAALRDGDIRRLGSALNESHESARVDYEVSCAELDAITAAARQHPDVFGSRLTGAGFGGCAIALVRPGRGPGVAAQVRDRFQAEFGAAPGFMLLHAGPGPREVEATFG